MGWDNIGHGWLPSPQYPKTYKKPNPSVYEEGLACREEGSSDGDSRWLLGCMVAHSPATEVHSFLFKEAQPSLVLDSKAAGDLSPRESSPVLENHMFLN